MDLEAWDCSKYNAILGSGLGRRMEEGGPFDFLIYNVVENCYFSLCDSSF